MIEEAEVIETRAEMTPLDPRVVKVWRAGEAIVFGCILLGLTVPVAALLFAGNLFVAGIIGAVWLAVAAFGVAHTIWYPAEAYRRFGYRLDEKVLEIASGVLFHVTKLLPLSRLQHVDVRRGPIERAMGLATLVLHTAGTREASMEIPGLDADLAVRLRDHLVAIGGDDAV